MQVFTPHVGLKLLISGLFLLLGLFAAGAFVGVFFDRSAAWLLLFLLGLLVALSWVGFRTFRWVTLGEEELVYRGLLWRSRLRLDAIERVELRQALWIEAAGGRRMVVRMEQRGKLGELTQALRQRLPDAFPRRTGLPFRWGVRGMVVGVNLVYVGLAGVMGAVGTMAVVDGAWQLWRRRWGDGVTELVMGLLMGAVGLLILGALLTTTLLWVDFGPDRIVARYPLRWRTHRVAGLRGLRLAEETRTYRGIARTAWFLELRFEGGRSLRIEPTENGVPADYAAAADQDELTVLRDDLARFYGVPSDLTAEG